MLEDERIEKKETIKWEERKNADELEEVFESEIQALERVKALSNSMLLPDTLDDSIQRGMAQGVKSQKAHAHRKWSTLVACFLLIVLLTSVRVSPTLAAALQHIPGLGYIVELINYDKGLQSAVENDFIQPLGVSDEHEDILFTVDGIIMDESSLIIFYTIEDNGDHDILELSRPELFDEKGANLAVSLSHGSSGDSDPDGDGKVHEKINVNFSEETILPELITLKARLHERKTQESSIPVSADVKVGLPSEMTHNERPTELTSIWEVKLPVDKTKFAGMKTVYEIGQSVVIEGQKITFERATVYPTRTMLQVAYDPTNAKKIFIFDDLKLLNENGQEWGRIMNGVTGTKLDENHELLYFQSNYFTEPKELILQGKSIRALDKNQTKVVLDLDQGKILESPPGLTLDQMMKTPEGQYELHFLLKIHPEYDENRGYSIFNFQYTDALGKSYDSGEQGTLTHFGNDEQDQTLTITLPGNATYQSPITFQLNDYPSRIFGEINLRIK